jgi:predicted amidohydrolase YtcJ
MPHRALVPGARCPVRKPLVLLLNVVLLFSLLPVATPRAAQQDAADLVLLNGKIVTVDPAFSLQQAVAIKDGRFVAVGTDAAVRAWIGPSTRVVDLEGRTVIPGLIDSHIHAIRGALLWDFELHWENTPTLADALQQIAAVVARSQPGSWIQVVGGWHETQFPERRIPTRAELDAVAPDHPVYVQHMYERAVVNSAALAAAGLNRETPDPPGGTLERDPATGDLTGVLWGAPAFNLVYTQIPRPTPEQRRQSVRNFFRELNRVGLTSIGDVGGDLWPEDYALLADMARAGELTLRIGYYVSGNTPGNELEELRFWVETTPLLSGDDMWRLVGVGEVVVRAVHDGDSIANPRGFTPRPGALDAFRTVVRYLAEHGYRFQVHATQNATAMMLLDVIEEVDREISFAGRRIAFAHVEDATAETIARIQRLGGGITVQNRLAFTGERVLELWGPERARNAPPLRLQLDMGIPLGAGTDATRVAAYHPFLSLWWLITGKTVGGVAIRDPRQNITREEALRLYTMGSAWFTFDEDRKGSIEVGKLADLVVLSADYLTVPEDEIPAIESLLTLVGGRAVYAAGPFAALQE